MEFASEATLVHYGSAFLFQFFVPQTWNDLVITGDLVVQKGLAAKDSN